MWNFLAQAGVALAPAVIDQLLASGVPAEMGPEGMLEGESKEDVAELVRKIQGKTNWKGPAAKRTSSERVARILGRKYGKRRSVKGMRPPSKLAGRGRLAMELGMLGLFAAPLFMGGGGGEEAMMQEEAGGEGDLLALLQNLQGQADTNDAQLRSDTALSSGAVDMLDRRQLVGSLPSALGAGVGDLESIIRGNEQILGQIAHSEPMTLAQAYAMKGLYGAQEEPTRFDFGGLM
jgi:hypothetical protein